MANEKEIIKKLSDVVAKQQKIITKLAQAVQGLETPGGTSPAEPMGGATNTWTDVSLDVQNRLKAIPAAKGYTVSDARVGSDTKGLTGKINVPVSDTQFRTVMDTLRNSLKGASLRGNDGKTVQVSDNPMDITFTAMKG
jgi:hypothetical protein